MENALPAAPDRNTQPARQRQVAEELQRRCAPAVTNRRRARPRTTALTKKVHTMRPVNALGVKSPRRGRLPSEDRELRPAVKPLPTIVRATATAAAARGRARGRELHLGPCSAAKWSARSGGVCNRADSLRAASVTIRSAHDREPIQSTWTLPAMLKMGMYIAIKITPTMPPDENHHERLQ